MLIKLIKIILIIGIIDIIYLSLLSREWNKSIKKIQGSDIRMRIFPTIIVYISLVILLYYFIISEKKSVYEAFILGMLIYGVFDFTNYAIIKDWSLKMSIIDTIWGGILFGLTTYIYYKIN